jgi:hypothetical protein
MASEASPRFSSYAVRLAPAGAVGDADGITDELRLCTRALWIWLVFRTVAWTLLASTELNGRLDLLEWLAWGHQWQLGYHKHPPLAAWFAAAFHNLTPGSLIGVYFLSNLTIAFTLWCVWPFCPEPRRLSVLHTRESGIQQQYCAVRYMDGHSPLAPAGVED